MLSFQCKVNFSLLGGTSDITQLTNKESARWLSHRFFLNSVKIKFPYVVTKWQIHTTHYSEILKKTVLILEKIFTAFHIPCFCAVFFNVWWGRVVICVVFIVVTSVVRISLLDFFFVNFVLHVFKYHFCSLLLVSVFLILLIMFVKFMYSINRKLYFISCFIQLTKLCVKVFSGL